LQALASLPLAADISGTGGNPPWSGRLRRRLAGSGFHRDLSFELALTACNPAAGGAAAPLRLWRWLAAALGGGCVPPPPGAACDVALVQPLPAGAYADMDQLSSLAAARLRAAPQQKYESSQAKSVSGPGTASGMGPGSPPGAFAAQLFGTADAERTKPECQPTALVLRLNATAGPAASSTERQPGGLQPAAGAAIGAAVGGFGMAGADPVSLRPAAAAAAAKAPGIVASLTVPVHARYPAPAAGSGGGGAAWSLQSLQSPMVTIELPPLAVRVRCNGGGGGSGSKGQHGGWHAVQLQASGSDDELSGSLKWSVPAGSQRHATFVNAVSAVAYVAAAAAVITVAIRTSF